MSEAISNSVFATIEKLVDATALAGREVELPADVLSHFERAGLERSEVNSIVGIDDSVHLGQYDMLSHEQTDRVVRLNHVMNLGDRVFGRREKVFFWLRSPNSGLGKRTPMSVLGSETGARLVEAAMLRIEHGIYA